MKQSFSAATVSIAALALSIATAPAFAGKQVKPKEMTCEEFLVLDADVQPYVVYWLHGKSGESEAIDIDEYSYPVEYVVTECSKEKQATVWEKVKHYFKTHTKPPAEDNPTP